LAEGRDLAVPPRVMELIQSHPWPGNVRELKNACERMVILCRGNEVSVDDLPPVPGTTSSEKSCFGGEHGVEDWPPLPPDGLSLVDLEKRVIEEALRLKRGNITQAAVYLRIPRHILVYRIEKYGLRRDP